MPCNNCPNLCNIDRDNNLGPCGVHNKIKLARAGLHFGEEPCISGINGSGTIFFSGCPLKCVFCQNYDISHECFGEYVSTDKFIDIMKALEACGAHNINFVTPTHYVQKDLFDVYLFDLKYFSREKSEKYSGCKDYFEVASNAVKKAVEIVGKPIFDENGILKRGVVVRHLILPSSTQDTIQIIKWLNNNTPEIIFSLMSQYVPMFNAEKFNEINRKITKREYDKVLEHCYDCRFSEIYIQDLSSATKEFTPSFDLTGIETTN